MQSLLSRAVEEQAAEQRAVSTLLGQIVTRLETLARDVTSLGSLGDAVGAVDVDLRTSTTLLADRINALSSSIVEQASTGASVLGRDVAGLRSDLARIAARPPAPALDDLSQLVRTQAAAEREQVAELLQDGLASERPVSRSMTTEVVRDVVTDVVTEVVTDVVTDVVTEVVGDALAVERAHSTQTLQAVIDASEERVLAYVDQAVMALAEALLLPRGTDGRPGLASATDEPSDEPSPAQPEPSTSADPSRRGRWRAAP